MTTSGPVASIIVCTHNRREMLPTCLESLLADTSMVERELLVVDNASTDGTKEYLTDFVTRPAPFPVRYVHEAALGLSNARNRGIRETHSEFVLFTDDDVWVDDGWADAMVAPFENPYVAVVGGRVVAAWSDDAPAWARELRHGLFAPPDFGPRSRRVVPPNFVVGASLAVRRAALQSLGDAPFDPRLGVSGKTRVAHEDAALVQALGATHVVQYTAEAVVHHPVTAGRTDAHWIRKAALQEGIGAARSDLRAHEWRLSLPHRAARLAVTAATAAARRLRHRESTADAASVRAQIEAFHWTGRRLEYLLGERHPALVDRVVAGRHDARPPGKP